LRRFPRATMGVFLTHVCPVQCAHCAVDAPADGGAEPDPAFLRAVGEMSRVPDLIAAVITGGEPFFEYRLLEEVAKTFRACGKRVVVYTSGYWGRAESREDILPALENIDGLVFGVDLYHRAQIPDAVLIHALQQSAERGAWIAAQVVGTEDDSHMEYAAAVFRSAFGPEWENTVAVARTPPIPSGRARRIDSFRTVCTDASEFCFSIHGPTLLPDGTLAACCNENVVLRKGPGEFRAEDQGSFSRSLEALESRRALQYLAMLPPLTLLSLADQCLHPGCRTEAGRLCETCWRFVKLYGDMNRAQRGKFDAMAALLAESGGFPPPARSSNPNIRQTLPDGRGM
jgi:hypothetical protein